MAKVYSPAERQARLKKYRMLIFALTFFSYAACHAARQSWSFVKSDISSENGNGFGTKFLGYMDFAFLMSYATGLATIGHLGDKMDLRIFTTCGMFTTASALIAIGLLQVTDALSGTTKHVVFMLLWILNGFSQSTGMPGFVASMGNWFGKSKRGILMGVWIGMTNFGDICGYVLGGVMTEAFSLTWGYVPIASGSIVAFFGCLLMLLMRPYPKKLNIDIEEEWDSQFDDDVKDIAKQEENLLKKFNSSMFSSVSKEESNFTSSFNLIDKPKENINIFTAWFVPNVAIYAFLFASLKATVYGFLFWLPNYLDDDLDGISSLQVTFISSFFDVGIFLGGLGVGTITDMLRKRAIIMGPFICCSALVMGACLLAHTSLFVANIFIFVFIGFFLGGPYNVCQSAIMIDLSKQKALKSSQGAISTITSLIDGTGALFAAITQLVIPYAGVDNVFYVMLGLNLVSLSLLSPLTLRDGKSLLRRRQRKREYYEQYEDIEGGNFENPRKRLPSKD